LGFSLLLIKQTGVPVCVFERGVACGATFHVYATRKKCCEVIVLAT